MGRDKITNVEFQMYVGASSNIWQVLKQCSETQQLDWQNYIAGKLVTDANYLKDN